MTQARKLLETSGLTVKQISARLGYANSESFIRQFEKIQKTPPSCYLAKKNGRPHARRPRA
jgi:AraC-like DNA-binding protein